MQKVARRSMYSLKNREIEGEVRALVERGICVDIGRTSSKTFYLRICSGYRSDAGRRTSIRQDRAPRHRSEVAV